MNKAITDRREIFVCIMEMIKSDSRLQMKKEQLVDYAGQITDMDIMLVNSELDRLKKLKTSMLSVKRVIDAEGSGENSRNLQHLMTLDLQVEDVLNQCSLIKDMLNQHTLMLLQASMDALADEGITL